MSRNGAGVHSLPPGYLAVTGETIAATQHNTPLEDLSAEITASLPRNGAAAMTAALPMGGFKITGLAAAAAASDAARLDQIQMGTVSHATAVAGTADDIHLTFSPAVTTWTLHERIRWTSGGANTVIAPTASKDGGSTDKTIKKGAGAALAVGDTGAAGYECEAVYNGTDLILLNPATETVSATANNAFTGNNTHAGTETFNGAVSVAAAATFSKSFVHVPVTLTDAATIAWDLSIGSNFQVTLAASRALDAFTNGTAGQKGTLRVIEDGTGGWDLDLTNAVYDFSGGQIENISTGAGEITEYEWEVISAGAMRLVRNWMSGRNSIGKWKEYDKGAVNDGALTTQAHGLGRYPALFQVYFECTTIDLNWAVGDRILVASPLIDTGDVSACYMSATVVGVALSGTFRGINKTSFASAPLTEASWKLVFRVYE